MRLSATVQTLKPSATIAAAAKARELKQKGVTVFEFTLGEPDFTTPAHICDAAKEAMDAGHTHYTPASGIPDLKKAICAAYQRDYGLDYEPTQVVVSNGAKHSIHNVLTSLCGPGDEVIIPTPYWVSYSALVELTGATPVLVPTTQESGFCLQPEQFAAAVTDKTRLLMLNNPCNPTGAAYPVETLEGLARVAVEKQVPVLSDEIYSHLVYDDADFASLLAYPSLRDRVILLDGWSKTFAMTGWRLGYGVWPKALVPQIRKIITITHSCVANVAQIAGLAAVTGPREPVERFRRTFAERREAVVAGLNALPGVSCRAPGGAFYAFPNVTGTGLSSAELAERLLEEADIALIPGESFGANGRGYLRLSYAADMAEIEEALARMGEFLAVNGRSKEEAMPGTR